MNDAAVLGAALADDAGLHAALGEAGLQAGKRWVEFVAL